MHWNKPDRTSGFSLLIACSILLGSAIAAPVPEILSAPIAQAQAGQTAIASRIDTLKTSGQRWIEIDLSAQRLYAWEGDRRVYAVLVSTGKAATPTPTGTYAIQTRHRIARMQGYDYDVPDVPYTMYYHRGYAIHGAYWHHRFGTPVSHGCTNVAVDHARWLFNWAAVGTPVVVHD